NKSAAPKRRDRWGKASWLCCRLACIRAVAQLLSLNGMTRLCTFALVVLVAGCEKPPQRKEVAQLEKEIRKQIEIGLTQSGIKCYLETPIAGCEPSTIDGRYLAHAYIPSRMVGGGSPTVAVGQFLCTGPKEADRE